MRNRSFGPGIAALAAVMALAASAMVARSALAGGGENASPPEASAPAASASGDVSVELNKLEAQDKSCRAYIVINNGSGTAYKAMKLDLVMFRADGVIGKRFVIDLAPMKAQKKSVKSFDFADTPCDQVGSLLVNEVMECSTEAGAAENCLAALTLSSLSNVQFSK